MAAAAARTALMTGPGLRICRGLLLFFGGFECFFLDAFLIEIHLNAMVEVRFLEHLAEFAGAKVRGQCLLFVVIKVVGFGLLLVRTRHIEFLAFNHLLFYMTCPWSIG